MRIAVIEHSKSGDYAEYIFSLLNEKAKQNNYQIKTWSNSVPAFQQKVADNTVVHIYIENSSLFILNWMYKVKIPSILRKTHVQVVLDLNGVASDKIKIPQLLAADQFIFRNDLKQSKSIERYALKNFAYSTQTVKNILTYSREKAEIIQKEKVQLIPFTAPFIFKTYEWHDKIMVKAQHADNKEYFVSIIEDNSLNDFVLLLQAFSKFKKWQQSGMQLLILPKYESLGENIQERYKTYKYRDDVHLIEDIEEKQIAAIIASAHSFIHVSAGAPHLLILSIALQCSLPVISFSDTDVKEYAGNAVLFCENKNADALGNAIIKLYKDEKMYEQMKEEALKQSLHLNRKENEDRLWQLIETAAQQ